MSRIPVISIVACLLPDFGIGFQGGLPWRLSKEMKFFRQTTSSTFNQNKKNVVIMGRNTWESIPTKFRPLPNRMNIILSRGFTDELVVSEDKNYYECNSLSKAIDSINGAFSNQIERVYIIGGSEIYNDSFPLCDHWLITKILPIQKETHSDPAPVVDTYLAKEKLCQHFIEDSTADLATFLPPAVELPSDHINDSKQLRYSQQEKGLEFGISLWNRIK